MDLDERPQRRRGAALEDALLDAAWEELAERGYAGLTFEGVAKRAGTSRPVVYRRWPAKPELALAAVTRRGATEALPAPVDTGSLRGDLLAVLTGFNERRADLLTVLALRFGSYLEETGSSLGDLRAAFIGDRAGLVDDILRRADERGELDLDAIPRRVRALPFDLLRHDALLNRRPLTREAIEEIVDDVFLPLVRLYSAGGS